MMRGFSDSLGATVWKKVTEDPLSLCKHTSGSSPIIKYIWGQIIPCQSGDCWFATIYCSQHCCILFICSLYFFFYCQIHDYKEGTPEEKTYYIELWDVGGSVGSASSVKSTRVVFYNSVNGKMYCWICFHCFHSLEYLWFGRKFLHTMFQKCYQTSVR